MMRRHTHALTDAERTIISTAAYQERFWAKVEKADGDGCWIWKGACTGNGYGAVRVGLRQLPAHRVAWEIVNGPLSADQWALHDCDRRYPVGDTSYRKCVRPTHAFPGTPLDNARDRTNKSRSATGERSGSRLHRESFPYGEKNKASKLSDQQIREIRARYVPLSRVYGSSALGKAYGVHPATICRIVKGKYWKHVQPESEESACTV